MSYPYTRSLPLNPDGNEPMQEYAAPFVSLARSIGGGAASSVITLTDNTSALEVGAVGGAGLVMKWVATTDTQASVIASGAGTNFDHFIPANMYRRFVVPIERPGVASIVGVNKQQGLYNRVAFISTGIPTSSVIASEF